MYATTSISFTLPIFFISTLFATLQHAMQSAQAGVTVLTSDSNRAKSLGNFSFLLFFWNHVFLFPFIF